MNNYDAVGQLFREIEKGKNKLNNGRKNLEINL